MKQDQVVKNYIQDIFGFLFDKEFLSKIKLTFLMLILYRLLSFIPFPGINLDILTEETSNQFANSFFGFLNKFSGGAFKRMSVAFLGISPYITCSLFLGFAHHFSPYFAALKKEGALGRQKINDYTKLSAFVLAFLQGLGLSAYLQVVTSDSNLVMFPGFAFSLQTAMLSSCATIIIIWFSDQISIRGIGSGSSIIIYASIVSSIPNAIYLLWTGFRNNELSMLKVSLFLSLSLFLLFFVTFCERVYKTIKAQSLNSRNALLQYLPENLVYIKLNPAGIYPAMFAGTLLSSPAAIDNILHFSKYEWGAWLLASLTPGCYIYIAFHGFLIFCTSYVYAELVFNPEETAKRFRNDSIIAGKVPGKSTQLFLEEKLFYVATIGGVYLTLVCCLPELFITKHQQSLGISGTSYIIVVGVAIDLIDKVSAGVYSKFIEKSMKAIRKGYF